MCLHRDNLMLGMLTLWHGRHDLSSLQHPMLLVFFGELIWRISIKIQDPCLMMYSETNVSEKELITAREQMSM